MVMALLKRQDILFHPMRDIHHQQVLLQKALQRCIFACGGDLNLTIEVLTQLQVDGGLNQNLNSQALSAPNLSALDFSAFTENESTLLFNSSSSIRSKAHKSWLVFTQVVRAGASMVIGCKVEHQLVQPIWLGTEEAVANMYSEMREEAHDYAARPCNAYFEKARQGYIIGNKAFAKELSVKGWLHNMQMKADHQKAQESIYHQRNLEMQINKRERGLLTCTGYM
ncbi:Hypothetical predicted protein [Olea europaea subsp. europaea]|uniref:DUF1771 domain-containing protein n=1 Tax=Olea europaea subsp. europaea TaxID=158383 RepID=A0A8S0PP98_OLEEU|nr:Hypothetical predicted protein [Olea europaea subsp. europaea]